MSSHRPTLIAVGIAVTLVATGWFAYSHFLLRKPLDGTASHDFGRITITEGFGHASHTFRLTNRNDVPVTIKAIVPDCGCVTVARAGSVIEPGATLELPVEMKVEAGSKTAYINLDLGEHGLQKLKLTARGVHPSRLSARPSLLRLQPGEDATIELQAEIFESYDEPPPPAIELPPGFAASFQGWSQIRLSRDARRVPNIYTARLSVQRTAPEAGDDPQLVITLPGIDPVRVPLAAFDVPDAPERPVLIEPGA